MNQILLRSTAILGATLAACASGVDGVDSEINNSEPVAMLTTPVIAPADRSVFLDASESFDPDGDILRFEFEISDGSEPVVSNEPQIDHLFNGAGLFTVLVRAIDPYGAEGLATQDITVRLEYPDPPDFCDIDADCVVGDLCDAGVCFSRGGSVD